MLAQANLEVMIDIRDQLKRIADNLEPEIYGSDMETVVGAGGIKSYVVTLNARDEVFVSSDGMLSYEAILDTLRIPHDKVMTVSWHSHKTGGGGTLVAGQKTELVDGMIINCVRT